MRYGEGMIFLSRQSLTAIMLILFCTPLVLWPEVVRAAGEKAAGEIPPIDRTVPAVFETATFGLG